MPLPIRCQSGDEPIPLIPPAPDGIRTHRAHVPRDAKRYRALTRKDIDRIPQLEALSPNERAAMKAVSWVLPFRVNPYVIDELRPPLGESRFFFEPATVDESRAPEVCT